MSDDSSWGPEDGLSKSAAIRNSFRTSGLTHPAFDIVVASLLRLRAAFGGAATDGCGKAGSSSSAFCSPTFALFRLLLLFAVLGATSAAAASSCSGLGSLAAAAFLFRELVLVVAGVGGAAVLLACVFDCGVELELLFPAESLAAERVTLDDIRTASCLAMPHRVRQS